MSLTTSTMFPLGEIAPDFNLHDTVSDENKSLAALKSEVATVIMFICNHCPFVKHVNAEIVNIANEYQAKGVSFIAINANDANNYPEDSPENMQIAAQKLGYSFPYLFDETQEIAKAYKAACTPDFYIFDKALQCVYRGRLDGSMPGNDVPVTGKDLRHALDCIIAGNEITKEQKPSMGCNIKWKD